jgi:hypothetical protein
MRRALTGRVAEWDRRWLGILTLALVLASCLLLLASHLAGGGGESVSVRMALAVKALLPDHPRDAALAALAGERLSPSSASELTMLDVAVDGQVVERVVDTGAREVTAALVLERLLITADGDGMVRVWRRSDGALLGERRVGSALIALADSASAMPLVAAADRGGRIALIDLTNPLRPRIWPLDRALPQGERLRALAFSGEGANVFGRGADVVAVGARGLVGYVDATTGELVSRTSLKGFRGNLPWRHNGDGLELTAAKFLPEASEDREGLLVATAAGAVADLDLGRGQGKTIVSPGIAPGRITSLDRVPYWDPELALGAEGGLVASVPFEEGEVAAQRGPTVTGVALGIREGLWWAGEEGVHFGKPTYSYETNRGFGAPVIGLNSGFGGIAAIHPGGFVSILAPTGTGLSPTELEPTPAASFDPDGRLLVANGYDANHVDDLALVDPRPLGDDEYEEDRVVRSYRPDPDWWPEAEEPDALYVNDIAADGEFVVAAGQDPEHKAAVLVWDATGEPLRRLTLGTASVETGEPSVVARVLPMPGRHEIAAYSAVQELIAIWSTDSWQLETAIPVGPLGDLSLAPDERTIAAVDLGEDEEGYVEAGERTDLMFIDVDRGKVDHEVARRGVERVAWSPDGSSLATADVGAALRLLSPDGREEVRPPIHLEDAVEGLAWRPDGDILAASLQDGGIALVDPGTGTVSAPLPNEAEFEAPGPEWSPDGGLLAAPSSEYDESIEGFAPGPLTLWALSAPRLERRMCQLAARPATPADWVRYVDTGAPRRLCRSPRHRDPARPPVGDASKLRGLDLVYQAAGALFAADLAGHHVRIGRLEDYPNPTPAYAWSGNALAWSSPGQANVLEEGQARARSWPCTCSGIAWNGGEVVSLEVSGRALIRIDPERDTVRSVRVRGALPYAPTLLGMVGDTAVVAAYEREPDRSTPSTLFAISPDGRTERLPGDAHGSIYMHDPTASPDKLAFVAGFYAGVCEGSTSIGVVSLAGGKVRVRFPPSPLSEDAAVRSVQVAADGSVLATLVPVPCQMGSPTEPEPAARRFLLEGDRWRSLGGRGWDVQATAEGVAVLERSAEWGVPGELALVANGSRRVLAPRAAGLVARP